MASSFKSLLLDPKSLRSSLGNLILKEGQIDQIPFVRQGESAHTLSESSKESLGASQPAGGNSSSPPYQPIYQDLRKQDVIRLIKLDPKAATTNQGFKLKKFRLNGAPKFHALSYCWGSPEVTTQINCNGTPLKISVQLYQCLHELQSMPSLAHKWFWIDQICVNQDDLDERAHQVKLMRQIYSRNFSTVIWIGLCDKPCEAAFSLAQDIFKASQRDPDVMRGTFMNHSIPRSVALLEEDILFLGLPLFSDPSWEELKTLLSKPWFSRMWVIQEVVLSRNTPLLVYGSKFRTWNHLLWATVWMGQKGYGVDYLGFTETQLGPLRNIFNIWNSKRPWELQTLLIASKMCISTDPRDKVFALLGLGAETQDNTSYPTQLIPDYKKPIQQVYRDVTFYMISTTRSLILFSLVNNSPNLPCGQEELALPSWVPEFHNCSLILGHYQLQLNTGNRIQYERSRISATKKLPASIQEQQDDNTLILQGLKVDMVDWCSEKSSTTSEPFTVLRWCEEGARRLVPSKYRTFKQFLKKFLLAISSLLGPKKPPSADDFWDYLSSEGRSSPNLIYFLKFLKESNVGDEGDTERMRVIVDRPVLYQSISQFFITKTQAIGFGPYATQAGDIISVLFGGQAPFVLRPCGGHYHLLGECCVIGLMNGEAIEKWKDGQIEQEWFSLR